MSILRIFFIWIGGLMLFVFAFVLLLPSELYLEETIVVPNKQDQVWRKVRYFEYLNQWHPWSVKQEPVKPTISGDDGNEGALIEYPANRGQTLSVRHISHINPTEVLLRIRGMEPFNRSNLSIILGSEKEGTRVTLKFKANLPVIKKIFILWQEKKISSNLKQSLGRLEVLLKQDPQSDRREIRFAQIEGDSCGILLDTLSLRTMHTDYIKTASNTLNMWLKDRDLTYTNPIYLRFEMLKDSVPLPMKLIVPVKTLEWMDNKAIHDTLSFGGTSVYKHKTWLRFETADHDELFMIYRDLNRWAETDSIRLEKHAMCIPSQTKPTELKPINYTWIFFYGKANTGVD